LQDGNAIDVLVRGSLALAIKIWMSKGQKVTEVNQVHSASAASAVDPIVRGSMAVISREVASARGCCWIVEVWGLLGTREESPIESGSQQRRKAELT
jgi:hypothetical protein